MSLVQAVLVGLGATVVLDLWILLLQRVAGVPALNWAMVGRWFGNMPRGRFHHPSMPKAPPVPGETAIGWAAHYLIGAGYGLLLLAIWGPGWLQQPTLLPALVLAWAGLAAPFLVMMPGMGSGFFASKAPKPNVARLKSLVSHTIFGLGLYATAYALSRMAAA